MKIFMSADILLPNTEEMEKWAVIACDQFTSDRAYWDRVRRKAEDAPSTINLILPEAELGTEQEEKHITHINRTMVDYIASDVFCEYKDSYIYVERTLEDGSIRKGLVGMVDLETYDFSVGSSSAIRATEKTVVERIPPRMRVRRDATVELPHILMLCDDREKCLIEPVTEAKNGLRKLYDFDLMEDGGHITGWLVDGETARQFDARLDTYVGTVDKKYEDLDGVPMVFAVGDGNHSLATAKSCYEELKKLNPDTDFSNHPARYALVELENIHDEAQKFEPIHRVVFDTDPQKLLDTLKREACSDNGYAVQWYIGQQSGTIYLDKAKSELAVGVLQNFLDEYLQTNAGETDYIHDDDALVELAQKPNTIGFLLPGMEKSQLFRGVIADGALPRKTFSMGHAREKRYYLEGRKIK